MLARVGEQFAEGGTPPWIVTCRRATAGPQQQAELVDHASRGVLPQGANGVSGTIRDCTVRPSRGTDEPGGWRELADRVDTRHDLVEELIRRGVFGEAGRVHPVAPFMRLSVRSWPWPVEDR